MRVLHFIHWPKSGITTLVKDLVDASSVNFRHGAIFIVRDTDEGKEMEEAGISVYDISCPGILNKRGELKRIYNHFQPDVVHLHSFSPSLLHLLAVGNKIKTVRTIHNLYPYFYEFSVRSVLKRTVEIYTLSQLGSVIVGISNEMIEELPAGYLRLECRVVSNGIRIPKMVDYDSSAAIPLDELKLLSVGRLEDQKGYDLLIKAVSMLSLNGLSILVTIVGEGTQREALESQAMKCGVHSNIQFIGYRNKPYANLDVSSYSAFISSSKYEGFGLAIAEAMANGLPVLVTKSGGITNSLKDNWNAIVMNYSAETIAEGIKRFSNLNIKEKAAIRMRGYEFISSNFSIQNTAHGYEEIYQS